MYKVRILIEGPKFSDNLQGHCEWIIAHRIEYTWKAEDGGPFRYDEEEEFVTSWWMTFTFKNAADAMRFRLVRG